MPAPTNAVREASARFVRSRSGAGPFPDRVAAPGLTRGPGRVRARAARFSKSGGESVGRTLCATPRHPDVNYSKRVPRAGSPVGFPETLRNCRPGTVFWIALPLALFLLLGRRIVGSVAAALAAALLASCGAASLIAGHTAECALLRSVLTVCRVPEDS